MRNIFIIYITAVSSYCCLHQHSLLYHGACHSVIRVPLFAVYDQLNSSSYDFYRFNFMSSTADCLRLESLFEVSGRSAVLCGQQGYLEDGKQRGRRREEDRKKKSFECTIEKCRGNTNTTCSHMTRCFSGPQSLEIK